MTLAPLILAAALSATAAKTGQMSPTSDVSSNRVKASGSTTYRSNAERWADVVNVKDFGAKGDGSTNDAPAFQLAVDYASTIAAQGVVDVPPGSYKFLSAVSIPNNVTIRGRGPKFSSVIYPDGCAAFTMLGASRVGGYAFRIYLRDLLIQPLNAPSATKVIEIDTAYNIHIDHVFIYNVPTNDSQGISAKDVNDLVLNSVVIYGTSNGATSVGLFTQGTVWGKLFAPDFENLNRAILSYANAGQLDVYTPYFERNIVGWANYGTYSVRTVHGGVIAGTNASTIPIADYASTSATLVVGTSLPTGTGTVQFYGVNGWNSMFYDSSTKRLALGPWSWDPEPGGTVLPPHLLTLNQSKATGQTYGLALGKYVQYIGAVDAFQYDWNFISNETGTKTARFFGPAGNTLSLYTDGTATADAGFLTSSSVTADAGIRIGSGGNAGTQALTGGSASVTVASGLHGCVCTDTTAAAAVRCSVSGTTLSIVGTGTDTIAFLCF